MGRAVAALLLTLGLTILVVAGGGGSAPPPRSERPVWAFLPLWQNNSISSFRHHASQIQVVLPTGLHLAPGGRVADWLPADVTTLAHRRGVAVTPVVSDYSGRWAAGRADRVLRSPVGSADLARQLAAMTAAHGWDGLNVDLESLPPRDRVPLTRFVADLRRDLGGGLLSVDVPAGGDPAFDLRALSRSATVVLMAYDQYASAGAPGPIASPDWVRAVVGQARAQVPSRRLVVALPGYGYDWAGNRQPGDLEVVDGLSLAAEVHATPRWSTTGGGLTYRFTRHGVHHTVWLADAVTLANDLRAAGPGPVGLWGLGSEDPGIWPLLAEGHALPAVALRAADTIPPPDAVALEGTGDVVRAVQARSGSRVISPGWRSERILSAPHPWGLLHFTGGGKRLAITFDDGPNATWTPQIIAEARRLHIPATFFVVGRNAVQNPGLVRQEFADGFTIGNHSFNHPDMTATSDLRTRLEVTANNRVIAGLTGSRPLLFRAPYAADSAPSWPAEIRPLIQAQRLGMTVVDATIDSEDYLRPGVSRIVQNVMRQLPTGNIVLFHDSGGNRSQTVAALPLVVARLRARGYQLVSLAQLMGVHGNLMQPVHGAQLWLSRAFAWALVAWYAVAGWAAEIAIALLVLLGGRVLLLWVLAERGFRRRRRRGPVPGPMPSVTVLVPAHDEATTIGRTLDSLLTQRGVAPEIIVIDDGSTDGTAEIARRDGVRVIQQDNRGKWSALNRGLSAASGVVIVAIDADTQLDRDAVAGLARWFNDPAIGAVSGNAKVGNRHTLATQWQHLEYVTSFNLDRLAHAELNAITVVPGAIGAWRRSAVLGVGGYSGRTLAEDCDLTIALLRAGWRVQHEPGAIAWTEAPERLRGLARQRLRWTFGTFQVLWANRDALFRRRAGALGWLALPWSWLYLLVISPLGPVIDVSVVVSYLTSGPSLVLEWLAIATLAEMAVSTWAFLREGERAWTVLLLPLQRFAYRQVMYLVAIRAIWRAIGGRRFGWGRLARTGAVRVPVGREAA